MPLNRRAFLPTILLLPLAVPRLCAAAEAVRRPSRPEVRREQESIVTRQLRAWRENRPAEAYACAARGIRARFPLAAFVEMVRRGYPAIAANRGAEFGAAFEAGATGEIAVRVLAEPGEAVRYLYDLVREDEGWRIAGVRPDRQPRAEI